MKQNRFTSKTLALLLAAGLTFGVSGCANSNDKDKNSQPYKVTTSDGREVELTDEQMAEIQKIVGPQKVTYKVYDENGKEVELTEEQMAEINAMVEANKPLEYDYNGNVVVVKGEEYIELTTERFEELVTKTIKYFESEGLAISREDAIKFVMVFNIDKLKQDNPALARKIQGAQTTEEVFADAEHTGNTLLDREAEIMFANDNPEWKAYVDGGLKGPYVGNPELIPSVSGFVFDPAQQELVKLAEARRNEIIKENDLEKRSEMVKTLLKDLLRSDSEFRNLDDSTLYLILRLVVVPLDGFYCRNFITNKTNLNDDTYFLIVEFIAPKGSTEEEIVYSVMSGAKRNMMESLKNCDYQGRGK